MFSIRTRLIATHIALALLALSLVGALTLTLVQRIIEQQEFAFLSANAEAVALQAEPFLTPLVQQTPLEQLARASAFMGDVQVRILDRRQQQLASSGNPKQIEELTWVVQSTLVEGSPGVFMAVPYARLDAVPSAETLLPDEADQATIRYHIVRRNTPFGSRLFFEARRVEQAPQPEAPPADMGASEERSEMSVSVPVGDAQAPSGYVELSHGRSFGSQALETIRRAFLVAAAGVTAIAVVMGGLVGRGLAAPIRELTSSAQQMGGGNLSVRASEGREDEIGALARQFNLMASRLEDSFNRLQKERDVLRTFIADASHELRTPITALRNFIELLQGPARQDAAATSEFLDESAQQLRRLSWITDNLLSLSRLDAGLVEPLLQAHGVDAWLEGVVGPFQTLAGDRGLRLSMQGSDQDQMWVFDEARLAIAMSNLIDNALKFTPATGEVTVGASVAADQLTLWVEDDGEGIEAEQLPHIFKRFHRASGDAPGYGLGLAIAQSIVQMHQGAITVQSEVGLGSRFEITLPRLAPGEGPAKEVGQNL